MTTISLSGKKSSGKTTIANLIREILVSVGKDNIHIISWADGLKREVAKASGVSVKYLEEHKDNFRLILQGWGTDFRRNLCSQDYWVDQLLIQLKNLPDKAFVIIPDTRFLNEAQTIQAVNGHLWKINRQTQDVDTHASENELNDYKGFDLVINNNVQLGELKGTLRVELEKLKLI